MVQRLVEKAEVLIEALPYIRKFFGKTFVIKYGGAAQTDESLKHSFAQDVVLMDFIGIRPVIVHGGGPTISSTMEKMGKKPSFVQGHRVTDEETMDIVEMVLGGLVNKQIVSLINSHGGRAVGLSGKDGNLVKAKRKSIKKGSARGDVIDVGLVGEVTDVSPDILLNLEQAGFIPVISPVGSGPKGETYNINGDDMTSAIASAVGAEKLIYLTDVDGVSDRGGKRIPSLTLTKANKLLASKVVSGGMLPKISASIKALKEGVGKVHIIDGRVPHCLLLEIFTDKGIGTEIKGKER